MNKGDECCEYVNPFLKRDRELEGAIPIFTPKFSGQKLILSLVEIRNLGGGYS
jgi:hypothetical protein